MGAKKIPVLKRRSYIEKFETVVKQEIALYNKKVAEQDERYNFVLQKINEAELRYNNRLDQLAKYCTDLRGHFDQTFNLEKKIDLYQDHQKSYERTLNDLKTLLEDVKNHVNQLPDISHVESRINHVLDVLSDKTKRSIEKEELLNSFIDKNKSAIENLERKSNEIERNIEKTWKEIEHVVLSLKKENEEKLLNTDWVVKDLKKKQKKLFVLEKKFEYLDDKIKKLEEKLIE